MRPAHGGLVAIERSAAVVGGLPEQDWSLRVTLEFRREERRSGSWSTSCRSAVYSISLEQARYRPRLTHRGSRAAAGSPGKLRVGLSHAVIVGSRNGRAV